MLKKKFEAAGKSTIFRNSHRFVVSPITIILSAIIVYVMVETGSQSEFNDVYFFAFVHSALIIISLLNIYLMSYCDKAAFFINITADVLTFVLYCVFGKYLPYSIFWYLALASAADFIDLLLERKIFFSSLEEIQADKKKADEKLAQSLAAFNGGGSVVKESAADEIAKFKKLLDEDAITQDEYEKQKQKILGFNATTA